jgi:hypothetical protein
LWVVSGAGAGADPVRLRRRSGKLRKVGACGGDVVGTYTISAGCVNTAALNMQIIEGCAGAKINSYNTSSPAADRSTRT